MKTLDQLRKELSPARRKKIDARTAQFVAEELTLRELRKAHQKTQTQVAKKLGMTQDQVSRLEQRSDVLLSTLRKYVEGMGGRLSLVAEFPDHEPVSLTGFGAFEAVPSPFVLPPRRQRRTISSR
jgi:transcriptional regulator with XRE-family HTH domain